MFSAITYIFWVDILKANSVNDLKRNDHFDRILFAHAYYKCIQRKKQISRFKNGCGGGHHKNFTCETKHVRFQIKNRTLSNRFALFDFSHFFNLQNFVFLQIMPF